MHKFYHNVYLYGRIIEAVSIILGMGKKNSKSDLFKNDMLEHNTLKPTVVQNFFVYIESRT